MQRFTAILLLLSLTLLFPVEIQAQNPIQKKKETPAELKKAATNLEKSLIENDNSKIALNYELLAQGFADKDDLAKAEESLFKALEIYTAGKNIAGRARVIRSIAKVQESQNKLRAAAKNYKVAQDIATDKISKTLNSNDYKRLKSAGNKELEDKYLNANIELLEKINKKGEAADVYILQAELNLKSLDTLNALEKYNQALRYAKRIPGKVIKIYSEIAQLQLAGKHYDETVSAVEKLLEEAKEIEDYNTEIAQLRYLASIYFEMNDAESAVNALKESYKVASVNGKTFEARETLLLLVEY